MRGKAGSRGCYGGGNALYLRTRYCKPETVGIYDYTGMVRLSEYIKQKGITRHKVDGLLIRGYLLCMFFGGAYWVMENPFNLPTEREFINRLPKRKRNKTRGYFKSELEYYKKQLNKT